MVRVNLVNPKKLSDQHLIAEYRELLMLAGFCKKHPCALNQIPAQYALGPGHVTFFQDKIGFIKKRHEKIRAEMKRRGFNPRITLSTSQFPQNRLKNWKPNALDREKSTQRIIQRIKQKIGFYRYDHEKKSLKFFKELLNK